MPHRPFALLAVALALAGVFAAVGLRATGAASPSPEIFAPGTLTGPARMNCLTYAGKDQLRHLYTAFRRGDDWGAPVDLGDTVDRYQPWGSHLGPGARTLYFTSNATLPVHWEPWLAPHRAS